MKIILTEQQVADLAKKISGANSNASGVDNPFAGADEKFKELAPNLSKLASFLGTGMKSNNISNILGTDIESRDIPNAQTTNDTNQQILQKTEENEMMHPLGNKYPIDSGFGPRKSPYDPISGKYGTSDHKGVDIDVKSGSPVYAPLDGVVIDAYDTSIKNNRCGGLVKIDHGDLITKYCHLRQINVKKGDNVKKGQVFAYTGGGKTDPMRGTATGPHLHYEIIKKETGLAYNPVDIQHNLV